MGIRLDRYIAEQVQAIGTAQHALYLQELENLKEFFDIEYEDDGDIAKLMPKEFTLDLFDRMGYVATLDFIHERTAMVIDEAEIEFETDVDVVPTKDKDDDDGFIIETSTKKRGLFKDRSFVKIKLKLKGKPESQSMRFLRTHLQTHFMDELQGFPKKNKGDKKDE